MDKQSSRLFDCFWPQFFRQQQAGLREGSRVFIADERDKLFAHVTAQVKRRGRVGSRYQNAQNKAGWLGIGYLNSK